MAIELRQFHQTFFDESFEGLATMEASLLHLERRPRSADPETLNAIFRVVHSIKGGSGTFGFGWIADFSHLLEGLLEELRAGMRKLDKPLVALLLRGVDCLRSLLEAARTDSDVNRPMLDEVTTALEDLTHRPAQTHAAEPAAEIARRWHIEFRPRSEFFLSANDPLQMLRELARLGKLTVRGQHALPAWRDFDPERCYLGFAVELEGEATRAMLDEIFSWVIDSAEVKIAPLTDDANTEEARGKVKLHGTSLRISTHKVDTLMDSVGELVITQTMLQQTAAHLTPAELPRLLAGLAQLERNVRELQEGVMAIRLLPLGFVLSRLPRLVRDLGAQLGKRVELRVSGEHTELDKTVIERVSDPILHMVRNAIDHGIETPAERRAAGKPETGTIRIEAQQRGGNVVIEIEDDGRGLAYDKLLARAVERGLVPASAKLTPDQLNELFFAPGMTTSDAVTDISGRGVGLDVVRNNVRGLGGNVDIASRPGEGTRLSIRLPLTLAILDGLGVLAGDQTYVMPLVSITESVRLGGADLQRLPDGTEVFLLRKEYLPLLRLHRLFGLTPRAQDVTQGTVVVIEADGARAGLFVDEILGQQQVVIKNLETHYRRIEGVAAATILGDGTVALILDASGLIRLAHAHAGTTAFGRGEQMSAGAPLH